MKPSFFSGCHPEKNRVDITGYPSNHFPRCRFNRGVIKLVSVRKPRLKGPN